MNQQLTWYYKDGNNRNYQLNSYNLDQPHFDNLKGVYIVSTMKTGIFIQSMLDKVLSKIDLCTPRRYRIQHYASKTLYITWAKASEDDQDGIEAYLHERLNPLVRDRTPTATPIVVNLPWN